MWMGPVFCEQTVESRSGETEVGVTELEVGGDEGGGMMRDGRGMKSYGCSTGSNRRLLTGCRSV